MKINPKKVIMEGKVEDHCRRKQAARRWRGQPRRGGLSTSWSSWELKVAAKHHCHNVTHTRKKGPCFAQVPQYSDKTTRKKDSRGWAGRKGEWREQASKVKRGKVAVCSVST